MGHEDREKKFEQALTRHLRLQGGSAQTPKGDFVEGQPGGCLDLGTLADLHERSLSGEEIRAAQQHVAECARCRDILESLKATDEIELGANRIETDANRESLLSTGGLYMDYASRENPYPAPWQKNTKAPTDISTSRKKNIGAQIYATVTLLAAGIVIFIALGAHQPFSPYAEKRIEIAQSRDASEELAEQRSQLSRPAPPPAPSVSPDPDALKQSPENKTQTSVMPRERSGIVPSHQGQAGVAGDLPGDAPPGAIGSVAGAYDSKPSSQARSNNHEPASAPPPAESMAKAVTKPAEDSADKKNNLPLSGGNQVSMNARNDRLNSAQSRETAGDENLSKEKSRQSAAPSSAPLADSADAPVSTDAVGAHAAAPAASSAPSSAAPAAPAAVKQNSEALQTASAVNRTGSLVATLDGRMLWRLLNGKIDRSVDGGLTWLHQNSGTSAELVSGSAPSEAVCWVVGRQGTILRTTDGGGHWSKLVSPVAGDVSDIRAIDAMHATIFAANGAAKFATSDGGATWKPAKQ